MTTDDRGLAALAAMLHDLTPVTEDGGVPDVCNRWPWHEDTARSILGDRGVFLPEGLPDEWDIRVQRDVFLALIESGAAEIASLRAALGLPGALCGWTVNRGDRCKENGEDVRERSGEWVIVCSRHRATLTALRAEVEGLSCVFVGPAVRLEGFELAHSAVIRLIDKAMEATG